MGGDFRRRKETERAEMSKENWKNRSQEDLDDMYRKATEARLQVAKDGSKLEHHIIKESTKSWF